MFFEILIFDINSDIYFIPIFISDIFETEEDFICTEAMGIDGWPAKLLRDPH